MGKIIQVEKSGSSTKFKVMFSRIERTWLRRISMLISLPFMVIGNLLLASLAVVRHLSAAILSAAYHLVRLTVKLQFELAIGFAAQWHRKPPDADKPA